MNPDTTGIEQSIEFGSFRLFPARRLLEANGAAIAIGSRALDILIVLVEREGEIVSKKELMSRAWPDITVDESSLRVHIAGLRKSLGSGNDGVHYIKNIPGRGYCFVAPTKRPEAGRTAGAAVDISPDFAPRLPPRLGRMIGRADTVRAISDLLKAKRFVTIHGPGGIGKTTTIISVGHAQLAAFAGGVHFLDLGQISDPRLLPSALASVFGLSVQSSDPTPSLLAFLRDRRLLLILDSCEHLIDPVAALAERIFQEAPQVSILATSRETLQVEGEYVYRLPALECPPEDAEQSAMEVLAFPAAHLFVERVVASGHPFELTDSDAPIVAQICRKLDGIALAIELAAAHVSAHGLRETAALLDNRLRLLWHGRRTALPRHQTLTAALNWSYDLLSDVERKVLRRLSIFMGPFTLDAACEIAGDDALDDSQVVHVIGQLVAKSLISLETGNGATLYRLLDTTRSYALDKLIERGEADEIAGRHASHYLAMLEDANAPQDWRKHLSNIRIALEWSLVEGRNIGLGVALAAASIRVLVELSLFNECHYWAERALSAIDEASVGTRRELELQAALGFSLMLAKGQSDRALGALTRGLELAAALQDHLYQFRILVRLHWYYRRSGDVYRLLGIAEEAEAVARRTGDPVLIGAASSLLGVSHHLSGNQFNAKTWLEAALSHTGRARSVSSNDFELQYQPRARIALACTLWLSGYPDRAVRAAKQAAIDPIALAHPASYCIVLIWGISVYHWIGDLLNEESMVDRLITHAEQHGLATYLAAGNALKGRALVARGNTDAGIDLMLGAIEQLHANAYALYSIELDWVLAEGLAKSGRIEEAFATLDADIERARRSGQLLSLPELLRIRGRMLRQISNEPEAEACLLRSLELAGEQSALSWQLRTATTLAQLWADRGRLDDARKIMRDTYLRFNEGFDTADLREAKRLLADLETASA